MKRLPFASRRAAKSAILCAKFIENGIGTEEGFAKAIAESDFGYDYIPEKNKENRLEGFLYPDTYEFYTDTTRKDTSKTYRPL